MMFKKRSEKKIEFITVSKGAQAVPGIEFLCVKDVVMEVTYQVAYTKGKIYYSESLGNITDNEGNTSHRIPPEFLEEYFKVKNTKNKANEKNL